MTGISAYSIDEFKQMVQMLQEDGRADLIG